MPYLTDKLESFLDAEQDQFPIRRVRLVKNAVQEAKRYSAFLRLVNERASDVSVKCNYSLRCCVGVPAGKVREERLSHFEQLGINLQLEIESFYLFSKIYLDKTVHFLETYFGRLHNCSFESFSKLKAALSILESAHDFKVQPELREMVDKLMNVVVEFRDKKITHAKNPRLFRGLNWENDGRVSMASGFLDPKPTDQLFGTMDAGDLWKLLESYTDMFTEFIKENSEKAMLRLNQK